MESTAQLQTHTTQETDVFAWANNLFEYKEDLLIELFLLNKNNIVYRVKLQGDLEKQLQPLFIDGLMEYVLDGAQNGLLVRGFEEAESEENVLQKTQVKRIEKLSDVLNWVKTQQHAIELFEEEHDLKRMRGVVARCSHPKMPQPFYVIKRLPSAQLLRGEGAWMVNGKQFVPVDAGVLRIPADNQLLVLEGDMYVFNQSKLEQLFGYNAKKASIAEKKARAIEAHYKLSFAEGLSLQSLVKDNKALINKLQQIQPGLVKQDELLDTAEELGLGLMTDEGGGIIILSEKDLRIFVNLLNDDYVESQLTGQRYEIKSKKPLKATSNESSEG
jgi:hypothetical protein